MSIRKEINFETEICEHLNAHGWLHEDKDATGFVRGLCLYPADVLAWVKETQPEAWDVLQKNHGTAAADTLLNRLRHSLDSQGTLHVLRNGIRRTGASQRCADGSVQTCQCHESGHHDSLRGQSPASCPAGEVSQHNENCLDLVLLLNGSRLPQSNSRQTSLKASAMPSISIATIVIHHERPQSPEPLLSFPGWCSCSLRCKQQRSPDDDAAAGDSYNLPALQSWLRRRRRAIRRIPTVHMTAYLWEQVWQRDSWLEILGRYLWQRRTRRSNSSDSFFPRLPSARCHSQTAGGSA